MVPCGVCGPCFTASVSSDLNVNLGGFLDNGGRYAIHNEP